MHTRLVAAAAGVYTYVVDRLGRQLHSLQFETANAVCLFNRVDQIWI